MAAIEKQCRKKEIWDARRVAIKIGRSRLHKNVVFGVPVVAQWSTNPTRNHEVAGLIPGLPQWVKDLVLP